MQHRSSISFDQEKVSVSNQSTKHVFIPMDKSMLGIVFPKRVLQVMRVYKPPGLRNQESAGSRSAREGRVWGGAPSTLFVSPADGYRYGPEGFRDVAGHKLRLRGTPRCLSPHLLPQHLGTSGEDEPLVGFGRFLSVRG